MEESNSAKAYIKSELIEKEDQITRLYQENLATQKSSGIAKVDYNEILTNQNKELIGKNRKLTKELLSIKQNLANLISSSNHINTREQSGTLKEEIEILHKERDIAEKTIERLSNENNLLKQALKMEQRMKVERNNKVIVLEKKLETTEREMKQCEDTRYNLSLDIHTLHFSIQKLTQKLSLSEQLYITLSKKAETILNS